MPSEDQDRAKLHAEINQAVNQRFLLSGAAITAFVLVAKELFPEFPFAAPGPACRAVAVEFAYVVLLWLLFFQSKQLRLMMRVYSTYLKSKGWSEWEADWAQFRSDKAFGSKLSKLTRFDLRGHSAVFLALCGLALISALYICLAIYVSSYKEALIPVTPFLYAILSVASIIDVIVLVWIYRSGFKEVAEESQLEAAWVHINNSCKPSPRVGG